MHSAAWLRKPRTAESHCSGLLGFSTSFHGTVAREPRKSVVRFWVQGQGIVGRGQFLGFVGAAHVYGEAHSFTSPKRDLCTLPGLLGVDVWWPYEAQHMR